MGTPQWRGWKARSQERDIKGERRDWGPPAGSGTENVFGYSTALSIVVVAIMLMILGCMFYIRKLNKKINYENRSRVIILVAKLIGKGIEAGGVVDRVTIV